MHLKYDNNKYNNRNSITGQEFAKRNKTGSLADKNGVQGQIEPQ